MTKTALLVSQRPSDYAEMKRCALALTDRGYRILFVYHRISEDDLSEAPLLTEIKALNESKKFAEVFVVNSNRRRRRLTSKKKKQKTPAQYSLRWFVGPTIGAFYRVARMWRILQEFRYRFRYYKKILRDTHPDIIILPEDVVGSVSPLMIRAGHVCQIPSLILPYTIANQQEAYKSLSSYPNLRARRWYNIPFAKIFRSWVMGEGNAAIFRLPVDYIFAHVALGVSPPDPWMMNSGFANAIAVENTAMYDYYAAAGIPQGKMSIVGAIYDDYLAKILQNKAAELELVRGDLGIRSEKQVLLIAGCPDQSGSCPGFEFSNIGEFAKNLADGVKELSGDYEIVVRPHPNFPELGDLLEKQGLIVAQIDTARLVAVSDLFIAFGSATIRWAVSCAVPSINYDVFRYDYSDFKDVSCVVSVGSYGDFVAALRVMRPGSTTLESLRAAARVEAGRWGKLDGHSVDRIIALIDKLCATKPVPRTAQ